MMRRLGWAAAVLVFLAGCGGVASKPAASDPAPSSAVATESPGKAAPATPAPEEAAPAEVRSVAVVSLGVNNYGNFGNQGMIRNDLVAASMTPVLEKTEQMLAKRFTVKKAASFIKDPVYRKLTIGKVKSGLYAPVINGAELPSFSEDRNTVLKGELDSDKARKLCAHLKVDAVLLVYSEWTIATGHMVPTHRALTKNCAAMYDKSGRKMFYSRKDVQGDRVIGGAFAGVHINEETISQWVSAYGQGIETAVMKSF